MQPETSINSFHSPSTQKVVKQYKKRVLSYITEQSKLGKGVSNNDIARATGIEYKLVSNARWSLMQEGKIRLCGEASDKVTMFDNQLVEINPEPSIVVKKKSAKDKLEEIDALCKKWYIGEKDRLCIEIQKIING